MAPQTYQLPPITVRPEEPPVSIREDTPVYPMTVPIRSEAAPVPVSNEVAMSRAQKASAGLGLDYQTVLNSILAGQEETARKTAAADVDRERSRVAQKIINDMAAAKGSALTEADIGQMLALAKPGEPTDPTTVFEHYFGKTYVQKLKDTEARNPGTFLAQAMKDIPLETQQAFEAVDEQATKREIALTHVQNLEHLVKQQGMIPWVLDQAKGIIPFYSRYKLSGQVEGGPTGLQTFTTAGNLEEQRMRIMSLPVKEYAKEFKRVVDGLAADNPSVAKEWAEGMVGLTTNQTVFRNIMDGIDVVSVPGAGVAAKGTKNLLLGNVKKASEDVLMAAKSTDPAAALEAAGDISEAAVKKASERLVEDIKVVGNPSKRAIEELPSAYRTDASDIVAGPGNFSAPWVQRISDRTVQFGNKILEAVAEVARVDRLPVIKASEAVTRAVKEDMKRDFPGIQNNIFDVGDITREPFSNTYYVKIKFGDTALGQWTEKQTAENFAIEHGLGEYVVVEQKGLGFHIIATKSLNETSPLLRNLLLETKLVEPPMSGWIGRTFGAIGKAIRGAEDTLSVAEQANRKVAAYARNFLMQHAKEEAKYIEDLVRGRIKHDPITGEAIRTTNLSGLGKKQRFEDWNRIVKQSKDIEDPDVPGRLGYFYKNPAELEYAYRRTLQRSPDTVEVEAYFAFKRMMEMDRFMRNVVMYRNKARLGTESFEISALNKQGERVTSKAFDGVALREFPENEGGYLFINQKLGKESAKILEQINPKKLAELREAVKQGKLKVIQVFDPDARPLEGFGKAGNHRYSYVIIDPGQTNPKPLSFNQVERRGGFHLEYDYDFYIKQAQIRGDNFGGKFKHWYVGDTTFMPVSVRAMGVDAADKMNAVRVLLKDALKDGADPALLAQAQTVYNSSKLGMQFTDFVANFRPTKIKGETIPPRLDVNEPFRVVPKDKKISDLDDELAKRYSYMDEGVERSTFVDGTRSGSLAKQYEVQYTQERDSESLLTLNNIGSTSNPVYNVTLAKFIDPVPAMNRALSKVTNSVLMDDYKIFSMEHWLQRALTAGKDGSSILKADAAEVRANPFYYFSDAYDKNAFRKGAPSDVVNSLLQDYYKIRQFTGVKSPTDTYIEGRFQDFADWVYGKGSKEAVAAKSADLLTGVKNAPEWIRKATFHEKMGLLNPAQFAVQLQTYSNIMAIAGIKHASQGTAAALATQWTRANPLAAKALGRKMEALGWRPGEFEESLKFMDRTGFGHVGGEYALLDAAYTPTIVTGSGQRILDFGKIFFTEGERAVRYGAWHTAYKEFREKLPNAVIGNSEMQQILSRADMLNVNMSAASASRLNNGWLSIPMQFLTYQLRMMELFFSKRLGETTAERSMVRARMIAWNSALYGAPTSLGLSGLPLGDIVREKAMSGAYGKQYIVGEKFFQSLFMEGIPSVATALATGKGDLQKGNWYNFGDRFGVGGFESIREAMRSDNGFWKLLVGAAGTSLYDALTSTDGFYKAALSLVRDSDEYFPLRDQDLLAVFKNITSVNAGYRTWAAMNTGMWVTKKEDYMDRDISGLSAIFMFATGLQPQGATDSHLQTVDNKTKIEMQKEGINQAVRHLRRAMRNVEDDIGQTNDDFTKARATLIMSGVPYEKYDQVFSRAAKGNETIIESADWSYYTRDLDPKKAEGMLDAYMRKQQINNKRKGTDF